MRADRLRLKKSGDGRKLKQEVETSPSNLTTIVRWNPRGSGLHRGDFLTGRFRPPSSSAGPATVRLPTETASGLSKLETWWPVVRQSMVCW